MKFEGEVVRDLLTGEGVKLITNSATLYALVELYAYKSQQR